MSQLFKKTEIFHPDYYSDDNILPISITELVENEQSFAIWLVDPSNPKPIFGGSDTLVLDEFPFMLQYAFHLDQYGGRTLLQDSINKIGPYVLDRKKNPSNNLFLRQSFDRLDKKVRILPGFPGNKVAYFPSFHYVGDSKEAINELKDNNYQFENGGFPQLFERLLKKIRV